MRCEDFMTERVATIDRATSADDAWRTMSDLRIHHLVVTDGGKAIGIVSDRDLGGKNGKDLRQGRTVSELMACDFVTATPRTSVKQAANLMRGRSLGCLPIVERSKVKGIVTITDLLELIGRGIERSGARQEKKRRSPKPGGRRGPERGKS